MLINYVHRVLWIIALLMLQVLVLNNIHLFGVATPFVYIYLLLKVESGSSRNALMLGAFVLGLLVDVFSDTPGMNACACVLLAFLRPLLLRLFMPRDMLDSIEPSITTMGFTPFLKFALTGTLTHHFMLVSLEYFSVAHWGDWLLHIVACTLLTVACIMALEGVRKG